MEDVKMRYMCILVDLQSPEISDWGPKFTFIPLADWVDADLTTVAADLRIITNFDMIPNVIKSHFCDGELNRIDGCKNGSSNTR